MLKKLLLLTAISSSIFAPFAMSESKSENLFYLSKNHVPVTTAVSDEFYQSLLSSKQADITQLSANIPQTDQEWKSLMKERNTASAAFAEYISTTFKTNIEKGTLAGVDVYWVTPKEIAPEYKDKLLVYVHGGAFIYNGGVASTTEASLIASHMKIPAVAIDYSKGPDHPAPTAMNDITKVWKELLKTRDANSMVMGGTSAGGNLSMVAVQNFSHLELPVPAALYLGTPAAEIGNSGDSRFINEGMDRNLGGWRGGVQATVDVYAGQLDRKDALVSPIYGSFDNFPPSYLISGTRDLMLSDTIRVHRELLRAGGNAELHVYEGQSHADYIVEFNSPESHEHYQSLANFFGKNL
jgi:epsilon-lactone hydrolase